MIDYANLLTEEQKEAFRKGDRYYKSPFKNCTVTRSLLVTVSSKKEYTTTTFARIHEARIDRMISRQWN
jgi:hypothetical protein